jgi:hypothetical protein
MGASLTIETPAGIVQAGGEQTVRLTFRNTGEVVDEFTLSVVGRASPWARITPESVNLFPGGVGEAVLRFTPPRDSSVLAGVVPYAVRVASSEDPVRSAVEEGTIEVMPFSSVQAEVRPETSYDRREGAHVVQLVNSGNRPEDISITASDSDLLLNLVVHPPMVAINAGSTAQVSIRVAPANEIAREGAVRRPFSVRITDGDGRPVATLPAAFQLVRPKPRPRWPVILALLVLAIGGLAFAAPRVLPLITAANQQTDAPGNPTPAVSTDTGGGESSDPSSPASDPPESDPPTTPPTDAPATDPPRPLEFGERVAGTWTLNSWTEAAGPITLYMDVLNGTMTINGPADPEPGIVSWRMDIQERGELTSPQPAIKCGGQTTLAGMIEGVPGGGRNVEYDWTSDLHSIDHSSTGEGWIWRAMCGWSTIGERAPFAVQPAPADATVPATQMEMTNQYGTFRWSR